VSSIVPGQGGDLALMAIAACVIGGLALTGGRGTILGVALGAAMIYTIQDVLLLLRAPGFYLQLFVGLLIIVAAGLNRLARGRT
jgi:ribose/xylose/arabinose/galactoside ABC-type transport system permease subunit